MYLLTCCCAVEGHVWAVCEVWGAKSAEAANGMRTGDQGDHVILVQTLRQQQQQQQMVSIREQCTKVVTHVAT
jgi:hypothetical protein